MLFFSIMIKVDIMYEITIENFNGPMDLLLHLIKESKMDIFNIKLEIIIDEYLEYIRKMSEMNLDIASSYLVMASELLEIKSKMLLPKIKDDEEEEEDPKERLINRLIEYQKYKDQVESFKSLADNRNTYFTKIPSSLEEYKNDEKKVLIDNINLDDLVDAFKKFLERSNMDKPINTKVTRKELSVDDSITSIKHRFAKTKRIEFFDLFEVKTKEHLVVTFLAVLELASRKELRIIQEDNFEKIVCEAV